MYQTIFHFISLVCLFISTSSSALENSNGDILIIETIAGNGIQSYGGDGGPAMEAQLSSPYGMDFDKEGNLFIVDYYNHCVRRIDANTGIMTTIAGIGEQGFSGDGDLAKNARLNGPYGIAIYKNHMFIGDYFNHRIRVIDLKTGIIDTFAGNGQKGRGGDGGPARKAQLTLPLDISLSDNGFLYISDYTNDVVRRVNLKTKIIETVAGNGNQGFSGDGGPAVEASLHDPYTMAVDTKGNLYISDFENYRIRKVNARTKLISTVAGNGLKGYGGDGGLAINATLNGPYAIIFNEQGHLIFSDSDSDRIRSIDLESGIIQTIAGTGKPGFSGDGDEAKKALLNGPYGLAIDQAGHIYIAEYFNHRIRRLKTNRSKTLHSKTHTRANSSYSESDKSAWLSTMAKKIFGIIPTHVARKSYSDNPDIVALGQHLFNDKRLSLSSKHACSTCHDINKKSGTDGKSRSIGHNNKVSKFNTPTVFNTALQSAQFHDARVSTIEEQAKVVLLSEDEMANPSGEHLSKRLQAIPKYRLLFNKAFPNETEPISIDNISSAIGAFERHLTIPTRFDQFMQGDLTALGHRELKGLELFLKKGCASCHRGPLLGGMILLTDTSIGKFIYPFLDSLGRTNKIKIPQLRNITDTAPYLHDGSEPSLIRAIESQLHFYSFGWRPERTAVDLTETQLDEMIVFLKSLSGTPMSKYLVDPP